MAFCTRCGTQNPDYATSCSNCGTALTPTAAAPTPAYGAPAPTPVAPVAEPGKGLAIASLVCGIVSFFCFGFILGILAVIFGGVAKSKGFTGGMATAGIVLGIIGLATYVILIISCGSIIPFMA